MATNGDDGTRGGEDLRHALEERVHTDLPRIRPEQMVTTQQVSPPPDPQGGRDTEQEFLLRHAGP
ncbi:hypothetical protein [Oryzobacter terrae]|uniref:hypothetical protein n=1 Tax=Oryzobacter terrae TaxID=1620385 RepID=UPI003671287F